MTENEAISALKIINTSRVHPFYSWEEMAEVRDMAIKALEDVQEYRKLGTVEEVRKAVEKTKAKKPTFYATNWNCQTCGNLVGNSDFEWEKDFCEKCGQKIDWRVKNERNNCC